MTAYMIGSFFTASVLSPIISYFSGISTSIANIVSLLPSFSLLPALFFSLSGYFVPRRGSHFLILLLAVWATFVFVTYGDYSATGAIRLSSYFLYYLFYFMCYIEFYRNPRTMLTVWKWTGASIFFYLLFSNFINPDLYLSLKDPFFSRYNGLKGPNIHGILSAIGAMALMSIASQISFAFYRIIIIFGVIYCTMNLWITGSRASIISLFIFTLTIFFSKLNVLKFKIKIWFIIILIASIFAFIYHFISDDEILSMVRFSEYDIYLRWSPVIWAYEIISERHMMPYGLTVMSEEARMNHLDNTYLMLTIEMGIPGTLILFIFIVSLIKNSVRTPSKESLLKAEDKSLSVYSFAAFISMTIHGLFESYLLVGLEMGGLLFLTTAAHRNATFMYLRKHRSSPSLRPASETGAHEQVVCHH